VKNETLKLSLFAENPDNPQTVTDEAFADLVASVRRDPETLAANKIAYCTDYVSPISGESFTGRRIVMAGNKRLRALKKIYGEDGEVPADWFFDLTPLGVEARRRWLVRSNVQTGEWEAELLMKLYSKDELSSLMSPDALADIFTAFDSSSAAKGKKDADAVPAVDAAEPPASRRGGGVRARAASAHVRRLHVSRGRCASHGWRQGRPARHRSAVQRRLSRGCR
jgi:hypothetical protein